MTPTIHRFLNAAIAKRRAYHIYDLAAQAARAGFCPLVERSEAIRAREDAAMACVDADTEFGMAYKLVTDPFLLEKPERKL